MIKIVLSYTELLEYLTDFCTVWKEWLKSDYSHSPYFYCQVADIKNVLYDLLKYYNEIFSFLLYENSDLNNELREYMFIKSTIFDIWNNILSKNSYLQYERDKVLYIPNYNFILSETKPISKCSYEEIEFYLKIMEMSDYHKDYHLKNAYSKYMVSKKYNKGGNLWFDYIPAFAEEKYILRNNSYVIQLHIPKDIFYIENFIATTDKAIEQLKDNINQCKTVIQNYTLEEKRELLNLILDSCNEKR